VGMIKTPHGTGVQCGTLHITDGTTWSFQYAADGSLSLMSATPVTPLAATCISKSNVQLPLIPDPSTAVCVVNAFQVDVYPLANVTADALCPKQRSSGDKVLTTYFRGDEATKRRILTLLIAAAVACTTSAGLASNDAQPRLTSTAIGIPILSPQEQAQYERTVEAFLAANPAPKNPGQEARVAVQNSYRSAEAAYWRAPPLQALAGQWGCTLTGAVVTVNPANPQGVITASAGTTANCGDLAPDLASRISIPETETDQLDHDPALAPLAGPHHRELPGVNAVAGAELGAREPSLAAEPLYL
jgi:hypothetical protein